MGSRLALKWKAGGLAEVEDEIMTPRDEAIYPVQQPDHLPGFAQGRQPRRLSLRESQRTK
jgi:hypothetical protein